MTLQQCAHGFHHPRPYSEYPHSCDGCWCDDERDKRNYGWDIPIHVPPLEVTEESVALTIDDSRWRKFPKTDIKETMRRFDEQIKQMVQDILYGKNATPLEIAMAKFDRAIERLNMARIPDMLIIADANNRRFAEFHSYSQRFVLGYEPGGNQ